MPTMSASENPYFKANVSIKEWAVYRAGVSTGIKHTHSHTHRFILITSKQQEKRCDRQFWKNKLLKEEMIVEEAYSN